VPALIEVLDANPPDGNLHLAALVALGAIGDPAASETLLEYLPRWPRRRMAVGIRDPGRIPDLLRLLDDGIGVAAAALAGMDDPRAVSRLERAYAAREWGALCQSYSFFVAKGTPGSENVLIEALNRCGMDDMGNDFFGSGHPKLREAAVRRSRFYSNVSPPVASQNGPRWGSSPR
jgi:hypothetical protein